MKNLIYTKFVLLIVFLFLFDVNSKETALSKIENGFMNVNYYLGKNVTIDKTLVEILKMDNIDIECISNCSNKIGEISIISLSTKYYSVWNLSYKTITINREITLGFML